MKGKKRKYKKMKARPDPSLSVNNPAIDPHFSTLNNSNTPKPHHRSRKFPKKEALIPTKRLNNPPRPVIPQQRLIREKHALPSHNPSVVVVVENRGRRIEELTRVAVRVGFGALALQIDGE